MNNKILVIIIYFALGIMAVGVAGILINNTVLENLLNYGSTLFIFTAGYLLVKNGEFIKSREYRISRLGISIILIGIMLKIMHWAFANEVLGIGLFSFSIIYFVYILRYKRIEWTNFLKLLFLITILGGRYLQIIHYPYAEVITLIGIIILIILVIDFIRNKKVTS